MARRITLCRDVQQISMLQFKGKLQGWGGLY